MMNLKPLNEQKQIRLKKKNVKKTKSAVALNFGSLGFFVSCTPPNRCELNYVNLPASKAQRKNGMIMSPSQLDRFV